MFERNRVDTIEYAGVAVEITTANEDTIAGRLIVGPGRTLSQVLNGDGGFVEFEPWGGDRVHFSKRLLRSIKLVQTNRPESLNGRVNAMDGFDPYTILGVQRGASLDEARSAWHRLSMAYHPDRYAMVELPEEVSAYLAAMARRINAAYTALETALTPRKAVKSRPAPAYAASKG
jgi:hypothetical protein